MRDSAQCTVSLSEGSSQLGVTLWYEGSMPIRQRRKQISKLMRRVIGLWKVVVLLHMGDDVVTDPGKMAQTLQEHSRWVVQGGSHDCAVVREYLRGTPKPRNWKQPLELVLPMTTEVMREAIKRGTAGDCSPGLDGIIIIKPLWHALAGFFVGADDDRHAVATSHRIHTGGAGSWNSHACA